MKKLHWPGRLPAMLVGMAAFASLAACASDRALATTDNIVLERQGSFATGGKIVGDPDTSSLHCDHGYVEYQIPANPRKTSLLMWHSSSAAVWQNRWDGGEGFRDIFLKRGYPEIGRAHV